jgi:hypothetical protein
VTTIQKGYGEIKLVGTDEVLQGEITIYAESWVSVSPVHPSEGEPTRWFPSHRVAELAWRKSIATRRAGS